jgi:hypothetical protein
MIMGVLTVSGGFNGGYRAEVSAEDHEKVGLNVKAPWDADFGVKIKMTPGEARILAADLLAYADGDGRS